MIPCFQLCGESLGEALSCFSMTMAQCTKQGPYRNGLSRSVCKNLTGLHRALTSNPLNTFGMNWNAHSDSGLIAQHQCPTSLMLMAERNQITAAMFQHLVELPSQRSGGCYSSKGGTNSILMSRIWLFQPHLLGPMC
jgi:hypothetical protein